MIGDTKRDAKHPEEEAGAVILLKAVVPVGAEKGKEAAAEKARGEGEAKLRKGRKVQRSSNNKKQLRLKTRIMEHWSLIRPYKES